ncbi:sensory box histidine kinase [Legionella busanensis]|uniref:histidine kinase n=1 Tax=Legionella busanensis TaxID=190655 RepID=A0A378JM72_9GAMM|nr:ATP-binding protein [Legionella busanensis]STX52446.1 sensory box histidine kinase [Legionella busanensis]
MRSSIPINKLSLASPILAILVSLLGLIVLFGWYTHNTLIIQVSPYFAPMQFNGALNFFLSGLALLCLYLDAKKTALFIASLIILLCTLTLLEYLLKINLDIDEFFMTHYITVQTSHPGRMAPNTAFCFLLLGLIIWLHPPSLGNQDRKLACLLLASLIILLGALPLFGYLFDWQTGWSNFTLMSIHSTFAFVALGLSYILWLGREEKSILSSIDILPILLVFFTSAIISIALWHFQVRQEQKQISLAIHEAKAQISNKLKNDFERLTQALHRVSLRWQQANGLSRLAWQSDGQAYLTDFPALKIMAWLNQNNELKWHIPEGQNQVLLTSSMPFLPTKALNKKENKVAISGSPIILDNKQIALPIFIPLYTKNGFDGYLFNAIDMQVFVDNALDMQTKNHMHMMISDKNHRLYPNDNITNTGVQAKQLAQNINLKLLNHNWTLKLWPSQNLLGLYYTVIPIITLITGLLLSVLLAMLAYMLKKLHDAQKLSYLILESSGEGIYGVDISGKTIFVNSAAANMIGWEKKELIQKRQHDLIHYKKFDGSPYLISDCPVYHTLATGETKQRDDEVFWRKDGSYFWADYTSKAIIENGKIIGGVVTFKDITTRKENEQQIKQQKNKLEAINKELEGFSYSVSHDLRAPLRHIIGYIKFLQDKVNKLNDAEINEYIQIISTEAKRMGQLIDDLLAFSHAGRFALNKQNVNFNETIDSVITELTSQMPNRKIEWHISTLPEVYVDPNLTRIVWQNLISNALKFTKTREVAVITIGHEDDSDECIFFIKDNGVGFDMTYSDKLFGVFQRLHTEVEFEGNGIGLSNVQRIISRHGGRVWATSELDKGAQFYFTLPKKVLGE